ncbi:MAG: RrF2 family transcriptional regulator [Granulosicoccaceae bacterium]
MHISKHTDFALRTLMYLGLKEGEGRCSIREISETFDISHNHLMKVVQKLSAASLVNGQRGKGGGIRLGKKPSDINIGKVVREFETGKPIVDCDTGPCRFKGHCKLEYAVDQAMSAFYNSLAEYTLADVLSNKSELEQTLHLFVKTPSGFLKK